MSFKVCEKSCNECPFTKTSLAGWLADYTPMELHSIVMNEQPFPCHMTHKENITWEEAGKGKYPLCKGALKYMKKTGKLPRDKELVELIKNIPLDELGDILSVREFFEHHKNANKNG